MESKILVAGATGRTGRIIVEKLIQQAQDPHVLVRDITTAKMLFNGSVTYHAGDVREPDTLRPCMAGVQVVISAIGSNTPVGKNCPKRVDYEGVVNLVAAAETQGAAHFILISSIAVTQPEHPLNRFGRILDWKLKSEQALRESRLRYTIIRPGGLTDVRASERKLQFDQGDRVMGTISRANVADTCLKAINLPQSRCVTFEVIEDDQLEGQPDWIKLFGSLKPDPIERNCRDDMVI